MRFEQLGNIEYEEAWEVQKKAVSDVLSGGPERILLCEHPSVYTLGANFHAVNLKFDPALSEVPVVPNDRGGDVTYHGPGQLVGYPILNLMGRGKDLHGYLRDLEQALIDGCATLGVSPRVFPPHTGVWIGDRKVCAIGIKVRRWVTMHGFALNVCVDLAPFDRIVPCGISGYGVTSLTDEAGRTVSMDEATEAVREGLTRVFA